jgi:hypothetical protein
LADGERDPRLLHPCVASRKSKPEIAYTDIERLVAGGKPLPGKCCLADGQFYARPAEQRLLPAHDRGDIDRPLREAPGEQAGCERQKGQTADQYVHQQVERLGAQADQERPSFLKKRSKKLLFAIAELRQART